MLQRGFTKDTWSFKDLIFNEICYLALFFEVELGLSSFKFIIKKYW